MSSSDSQPSSSTEMSWRRLADVGRKSVRYLIPMWRHLAALGLLATVLGIILVPVGLLLADVFWTRILLGTPLPPEQAEILGLQGDVYTTGYPLSRKARHAILDRWLLFAAFAFGLGIPAALGMFAYQLWVLQHVNQRLRLDLLDRLQSLSLRFHRENAAGDAVYRMVQDASTVSRFLSALVLTPLGAAGRFLLGLGIVSLFDPKLGLLLLAVWIPLGTLAWFRTCRLRHELREARDANARLTTRVQEIAGALHVVKASGSEDWEAERFEIESERAFDAARSARLRVASFEVQIYWILGTFFVVAFMLGADRTKEGIATAAVVLGIQVWTLGLWNYFCDRFSEAGAQAQGAFVNWGRAQDVFAGLGRVFDLLDRSPDLADAPDAVDLPVPREGVRFRDVSFAYDVSQPALQNIDFEAPVGTITAIVGPSGAGKSTLLSLFLRLTDPDAGTIEIDGLSLTRVRRDSLRKRISIALQEPLLFGGTIADNLRWAAPSATDADVQAAARMACAHDFIAALPDGYATALGERGVKLSTGQRQRLSIARALLKDPSILLLDEPTAALDAETEERLLTNLAEWGRGRTLFIVTHRPATAARADLVLSLDHGRVQSFGRQEPAA